MESRLYTFVNMYLSEKQHGIQTAHLATRLVVGQPKESIEYKWAVEHETIIMLNGGFSSNLELIGGIITEAGYRTGYFNEADEALNGALTTVGAVLPEKIYGLAKLLKFDAVVFDQVDGEGREYKVVPTENYVDDSELIEQLEGYGGYTDSEIVLVKELNKYRLA